MTKVIKLIFAVTCLLFATTLLIWFNSGLISNPFTIKSKETTHDIILEKVTALGQLELSKYHFKDIVEKKLIRDYLPDPRALLIVHGEATACINLADLKAIDIKVYEDKIWIKLPSANLCNYKVDHKKSRIYDTSNAFMNEELLFEEAYKAAEKKIEESALASDILTQAEANAVILLKPILATISQKEIIFE